MNRSCDGRRRLDIWLSQGLSYGSRHEEACSMTRTFLHLGSHLMFTHTQNKSLTALSLADCSWEVFTMLRANHPVSRVRSLPKLPPIKSFKKMSEHHILWFILKKKKKKPIVFTLHTYTVTFSECLAIIHISVFLYWQTKSMKSSQLFYGAKQTKNLLKLNIILVWYSLCQFSASIKKKLTLI